MLVGDVTSDLADAAKALDAGAQLLTQTDIGALADGVYYISLGDCSNYRQFVDRLHQAQHLIYAPPPRWSDSDSNGQSLMRQWTEWALFYFRSHVRVDNINFAVPSASEKILHLVDGRRSSSAQLWIAGGSDAHGVGVASDQRFGDLLAKDLCVDVSWLTAPGASMEWLADQISRSDMRSGDILVWSTVPGARFAFFCNNCLHHVTVSLYQRDPSFVGEIDMDQLANDNTLLYRSISSVDRVRNLCAKLGVTLVLAGLASREQYITYLASLPEYVHLQGRFGLNQHDNYVDFGSDGEHPGPQMHAWYAAKIKTKILALQEPSQYNN